MVTPGVLDGAERMPNPPLVQVGKQRRFNSVGSRRGVIQATERKGQLMNPPIDNADPVEEAREALKGGLRQLASEDWGTVFPMLGRPSNEFIRKVSGAALLRIQELEQATATHHETADHFERFVGFAATCRRENTYDSYDWMLLMLNWLNGAAARFDEAAYFDLVGADHFVLRRCKPAQAD